MYKELNIDTEGFSIGFKIEDRFFKIYIEEEGVLVVESWKEKYIDPISQSVDFHNKLLLDKFLEDLINGVVDFDKLKIILNKTKKIFIKHIEKDF